MHRPDGWINEVPEHDVEWRTARRFDSPNLREGRIPSQDVPYPRRNVSGRFYPSMQGSKNDGIYSQAFYR